MIFASRGTREQRPAVFSGLQNALRNDNIDAANNGCNIHPLKRRQDETRDDSDIKPPIAKKAHQSLREDLRAATGVERAVSPVMVDRSTPSRTCSLTVSSSSDCWQTRPRVLHRPFETASSVGRSEPADRQPSPAVSGCRPDDDRHDVVSWADCLRQLATALRRRQVVDDNSETVVDPASVEIPADVGSWEQRLERRTGNESPPDCKHQEHNCECEVEQRDKRRSVNDEDYCSSSNNSNNNNNNNLYVIKSDRTTTQYTRSVDDLRCSLPFNAAAVQADQCRGLNWLIHNIHGDIHRHTRNCFALGE